MRTLAILMMMFNIFFAMDDPQFGEIGDFPLVNGDTIKECRLEYRTFGKLNIDKSNAVIYPSWFGGITAHMVGLVGPGKLIDSTDFYVILVGALGNGISSSPSNSRLQGDASFPAFTIRDMVEAEYLLLNNVLGINHLYGIIGGSMGSMQVFEWIVAYPEFCSRAIAYVCTPQLSSYDKLLFQTQVDIIEKGWKCGWSEREILRLSRQVQNLNSTTPAHRVKSTASRDFEAFYEGLNTEPNGIFTTYNHRAQCRAMLAHDISRTFSGSWEKTASQIQTPLLIIINRQDHSINPEAALQFAPLVKARLLVLDNEYGHLGITPELEKVSAEISDFLK